MSDSPSRLAETALLQSGHHEAFKRYILFAKDAEGVAISYGLFSEVRAAIDRAPGTDQISVLTYHAACVGCAVRRTGRLLESLSGHKGLFVDPVADVIRLEWRKKKSFFDAFRDPRDAVEHMDKEAGATRFSAYNLLGSMFEVANGKAVEISSDIVRKVHAARDRIAEAIVEHQHRLKPDAPADG